MHTAVSLRQSHNYTFLASITWSPSQSGLAPPFFLISFYFVFTQQGKKRGVLGSETTFHQQELASSLFFFPQLDISMGWRIVYGSGSVAVRSSSCSLFTLAFTGLRDMDEITFWKPLSFVWFTFALWAWVDVLFACSTRWKMGPLGTWRVESSESKAWEIDSWVQAQTAFESMIPTSAM